MTDKKSTSVRLTHDLKMRLQTRVIEDNYGMRGRSRWIEEAITEFLKIPDYQDTVNWDLTKESDEPIHTLSLMFSESILLALDLAVVEVRKKFPAKEGVKASIIRAAIIHRLLN